MRRFGLPRLSGRLVSVSAISAALALPATRLLDGLYNRPELLFSSLAPLTPLRDNGTDKVALAIDTSQGVDVAADGGDRTFTGLGSDLVTTLNDHAKWAPYGANTIADISGGMAVTYVDSGVGAYVFLRDDSQANSGLSETLVNGGWHHIEYEAMVNTGSANVQLGLMSGSPNVPLTNSFVTYEVLVRMESVSSYIRFHGLGSGQVASIRNIKVKKALGVHGVQTTANDQWSYDWQENAADSPATSQHMEYPNSGLPSTASGMFLFKIPAADDRGIIMGGAGPGTFLGVYDDGASSGSLHSASGSPTYYINGELKNWSHRGHAHTDIATGDYVIFEFRGANLSDVTWRGLQLGSYNNNSVFQPEWGLKGFVLFDEAVSGAADRNQARQYLANLVDGLTVTDEVSP